VGKAAPSRALRISRRLDVPALRTLHDVLRAVEKLIEGDDLGLHKVSSVKFKRPELGPMKSRFGHQLGKPSSNDKRFGLNGLEHFSSRAAIVHLGTQLISDDR
jgi:hypothetical protein